MALGLPHRQEIDTRPIRGLLDHIIAAWQPEQIWLFGSRADGNASATSDWDLLAVVPDEVSDEAIGPLASWRLAKTAHVCADVVPCRARDFSEQRDTPNTLVYEVVRRGLLLHER
ncbi:MAG: nucleotidyltransferase domain-containing protein [Polyangiaceae bacterium]